LETIPGKVLQLRIEIVRARQLVSVVAAQDYFQLEQSGVTVLSLAVFHLKLMLDIVGILRLVMIEHAPPPRLDLEQYN
jgi:hypothetical protein